MFPVNQNFVSANAGLSNGNNPCFPMYLTAAPTTNTLYAPYGIAKIGQIAVVPGSSVWMLIGLSTSQGQMTATWVQLADSDGAVQSVLGTANQITATNVAGTVTLSTPAAFIAPGSIASTTTIAAGTALSAGTTITATLGNITATNGNLVLSAAGNKLVIAAAAPTTDSVGTTGAMVGGTVTITSSAIAAGSQIIYSRRTLGTAMGNVSITAQAGGSATLTSDEGTETSTFDYIIIN